MGDGAQALLMGTERGQALRAASSRDTRCCERHTLLRLRSVPGMAFHQAAVLDHGGFLGLHRRLLHCGGHFCAFGSMGETVADGLQREKNRST